MKRISLLLLIALIAGALCLFSSCNKDETPDGMKLAAGGEEAGYRFYVPEEWTVSVVGDLTIAYVSAINHTSVSYTEPQMPAGSLEDYFEASLAEFPTAPHIVVRDESTAFGNADRALRYVYTYAYADVSYRVLQVLATYGDRFGILTYTAEDEADEGQTSRYETYLEKVTGIIENFRYGETRDTGRASTAYEQDEDGWNLVSDKRLARFLLYLPAEMTVNYASGIVHAAYGDGASVTLARAGAESTTFAEYFETRKRELENELHVKDLTVITHGEGEEAKDYEVRPLGDIERAFAYEYLFTYGGERYRVYQVLGATRTDGFVFTYTAREEDYGEHRAEIDRILDKIRF